MAEGAPTVQRITLRDLTAHQRRELRGIVAAGIASAAFFAIPFVQVVAPNPLPSAPMALQMSVIVESPRGSVVLPPRPRLTAATATSRPASILRARHSSAVMTLASVVPFATPESRGASARAPRRISRLLFGDGRYRVHPFPTPGEQ